MVRADVLTNDLNWFRTLKSNQKSESVALSQWLRGATSKVVDGGWLKD